VVSPKKEGDRERGEKIRRNPPEKPKTYADWKLTRKKPSTVIPLQAMDVAMTSLRLRGKIKGKRGENKHSLVEGVTRRARRLKEIKKPLV